MVSVFGAFILSDERAGKLLGFGLAFAILILGTYDQRLPTGWNGRRDRDSTPEAVYAIPQH